jgi:YCII-related domain
MVAFGRRDYGGFNAGVCNACPRLRCRCRMVNGRFLLSGPTVPPKGGILIARAESLEELNEFLADEPYCKAKAMRFSKIIEFDPVQHQPILKDWFGKR